MEEVTRKIVKLISSGWVFVLALLIFVAETAYLALTSRFPMAFDESYHFSLIKFFSHRLNPIVTSQASGTYGLGAIVQNPSFLYHYLLSFPYRFIALFTNSPEVEATSLRFVNIALALASLIIMRKLLRLMNLSDALVNIVMLVFALTPMVVLLSAQINYDNLLILAVTLCLYETVTFSKKLDRKIFDAKGLLTLACLCLFTSVVKFVFLPIFLAITAFVGFKLALYRPPGGTGLIAVAKKSFADISKSTKLFLLAAGLLGSFFFVRLYGVNLVKYHNPAPQCNQVLNIQDCTRYYAWDSNYNTRQQELAHPTTNMMNVPQYNGYWLLVNGFGLFGAIMPLLGPYYISPTFCLIVIILWAAAIACTIVNFKKVRKGNKNLLTVIGISLVYVLAIWGRNYHDYLQLGKPVAIDGRYLVPVLIYFYALLGLGTQYALADRRPRQLIIKLALVALTVFSFIYYGGFVQYISHISPSYGRISPSNNFFIGKE
ncbi:MAG TPA: hypothetical protein VFC50_02040 [Candidatus Dormibacteraeota bacterium]|nr:hypothetical protein [Candidatus Dormibacteraeota bacterium]